MQEAQIYVGDPGASSESLACDKADVWLECCIWSGSCDTRLCECPSAFAVRSLCCFIILGRDNTWKRAALFNVSYVCD